MKRTTTEAMLDEGIAQIRKYQRRRFSVQLDNGKMGIGATVAEALSNAQAGQHDLSVAA